MTIWRYVAVDNPVAADELLTRFDDKLGFLAANAGVGQLRDELMPQLRSFVIGNYVLYYQPIPDGIRLLRILHGARDLRKVSFD